MIRKILLVFFLSVGCLSMALAQTRTINGSVTDKETGESLIGVVVTIKGASGSTQTDVNGKFTFTKLTKYR
jgi:hypothetical protein